jgi:hypothetical protein
MFAQSFTVIRSTAGKWVKGVFVDTPQSVPFYGIVQPATSREVQLLEEGDRNKEVKSFHSTQQFFVANVANQAQVTDPSYTPQNSDIAVWQGQQYRIKHVYEWGDFGYYKALGVRMGAN